MMVYVCEVGLHGVFGKAYGASKFRTVFTQVLYECSCGLIRHH